jgi:glycerol-3-phosphate dehydrogenase (NAD(P)+)
MTALRIAVLGAGNWGTTLAHLAGRNGHQTKLWTRDLDVAREINASRTNERSVPGLELDGHVRAECLLADAVAEASLVVVAIPSQAFRDVCRLAAPALRPDQMILHATKGLELGTHRRMSEIVLEETCVRQLGVLSGPNIAPEIAQGKPAGTVVASPHPRVAEAARAAFSSPQLMVFTADDVLGIELSGALKNVVAIAAGMAEALDVGENAKAFLVTRGLAEMMRLAFAMGATPSSMMGLAGIGDLMVTCRSARSRNHRVGVGLARGERLEDVVARLGMVAEGVYAARAAHELAKEHAIEMPLFEHVHRVLLGLTTPRAALESLMRMPAGRDIGRFVSA